MMEHHLQGVTTNQAVEECERVVKQILHELDVDLVGDAGEAVRLALCKAFMLGAKFVEVEYIAQMIEAGCGVHLPGDG